VVQGKLFHNKVITTWCFVWFFLSFPTYFSLEKDPHVMEGLVMYWSMGYFSDSFVELDLSVGVERHKCSCKIWLESIVFLVEKTSIIIMILLNYSFCLVLNRKLQLLLMDMETRVTESDN